MMEEDDVVLGSISVMVNVCEECKGKANGACDRCQEEVARLVVQFERRHVLSLGLHLNLTEGWAVTGKDSLIVSKADTWPLATPVDPWSPSYPGLARSHDDLAAEIEAQVLRLQSLVGPAVPIGHVDGHNHVHVHPGVAPAFATAVCDRLGLGPALRVRQVHRLLPSELPLASAPAVFAAASAHAWSTTWVDRAFQSPPLFAGLAGCLTATEESFAAAVDDAATAAASAGEQGEVEFMCHPGDPQTDGRGDDFSRDAQRAAEARVLVLRALDCE
jgi:predicted glycoside hydrolase/deacetylase ChbG (UPF0249 family)